MTSGRADPKIPQTVYPLWEEERIKKRAKRVKNLGHQKKYISIEKNKS